MPLAIPTSRASQQSFLSAKITKGQIYNLDLDEYFVFQFNPEAFEWERDYHWDEITFKGDASGGDLQYIRTSAREFSLDLLYVADPGGPDIEYAKADHKISPRTGRLVDGSPLPATPSGKMAFEQLVMMLDAWGAVIPAKGRPSRLKVMMGPQDFDCVVTGSQFRIREFFGEDLSAREALISLEFRQWQM